MTSPPYTADVFLIFARKGRGFRELSARVTAREPQLEPGEIPIRLKVQLPAALFDRPHLKATITVPDSAVPATLDALCSENLAQVLSESLGVNLSLTVEPAA